MKKLEKYVEGINMEQFVHIPNISCYNCNYYQGFDDDLLYAESDDDNTTEWYFVYDLRFIYMGESHTSENEKLHRYDKPQT